MSTTHGKLWIKLKNMRKMIMRYLIHKQNYALKKQLLILSPTLFACALFLTTTKNKLIDSLLTPAHSIIGCGIWLRPSAFQSIVTTASKKCWCHSFQNQDPI